MIVQALKQQTRSYHHHLEQRLALLTRPITRSDYQHLLQGMWGFYTPLEQQLAHVCAMTRDVNWTERWKAPRLEQDLQALGLTTPEIHGLPACLDLPQCATFAAALGCWYVVEGATLGGQVIARHLYPRLDLTPEHGGAFFASYGAQVGPMWQQFCAVLTTYATTTEREEAIIQAACATFITLDRWLFNADQRGLHQPMRDHRPVAPAAHS